MTKTIPKTIAHIGVKKIKELGFFMLNEKDIEQSLIEYETKVNPVIHLERREVEVILDVQFKDKEDSLLSIKVATTFYIENIADFLEEESDTLDIPENIWIIMVSLSFSHTRALLAKNTNGTSLERLILPIVDPKTLLKLQD
jgi:hypothetical protein